ncbi:hypothetical protein [Amycolatopsis sp. cmx-4-54]|uniref:hypothetical protein n=1 Tax=Amycolatopsis sp. cmx-4-54 TaxID=2790936 RepID=UPI00397A8955
MRALSRPVFVFVHGGSSNAGAWGLASDRGITPAVQDHMIRKADELTPHNPFEVRTLDSSHVGYFSRPRVFADLLTGLV